MAKDSIDRKTLKEDAFRDTMFELIHWGYRRRYMLIAAAVILVGLGASALGYQIYTERKIKAETLAFYHAEKNLEQLDREKPESRKEIREGFEGFLNKFPESSLSPVALMYLAEVDWEDKDYAKTGERYNKVLNHVEASDALKNQSRMGLAKVAEAQGNLEQSEGYLNALTGSAYEDLREFNLGRIALARNKPEEARKYFEKVAKRVPPSSLSEWARQALDYLP